MSIEIASIFVIVLNWNGAKDTIECLHSLATIKSHPFEIILVDNGSHDNSVENIRLAFPLLHILETKENLGFAEGNNRGIQLALKQGATHLLLLNNDTVVDSQLLSAFMEGMQQDPQVGILGAKIYLYDDPDRLDHLGGCWNRDKGHFDLIGLRQLDDHIQWEIPQPIDYACGAALFIKKEVFEQVGLFEKKFFLIWEESDFCFRARRMDFMTLTCPQAKIWHKVSASFVGGKPHSTYFWWRNRLLWIERNCFAAEKWRVIVKVVIPEIIHLYKIRIIKILQLLLLRVVRPKEDLKKRKERILKYSAALQGIKDYLFRRFDRGPSWIYEKK